MAGSYVYLSKGKSTATVVTLAKWEWFADWKDKQVMKRGDDYNYIKDGIAHHLWEQCLALYPQLRDKVPTNFYKCTSNPGVSI